MHHMQFCDLFSAIDGNTVRRVLFMIEQLGGPNLSVGFSGKLIERRIEQI